MAEILLVNLAPVVEPLAGGLPGCLVGTRLLARLSPAALQRLFGGLVLFAAVRMWLR